MTLRTIDPVAGTDSGGEARYLSVPGLIVLSGLSVQLEKRKRLIRSFFVCPPYPAPRGEANRHLRDPAG